MNIEKESSFAGGIKPHRGALPIRTVIILSLTSLLTSLTCAFVVSGLFDASIVTSWATCVLCAMVMFTNSKKTFHAILKTIALGLTLSLFGYPIIPALIFGGVISIGAYSSSVCSSKKKGVLLPILLPVISYGIALAVTLDPVVSLAALALYIPASLMGIATRKDAAMTSATLICASALFAITAGVAALALYYFYGSVSQSAAESFTRDATELLLLYYEESFKLIDGLEFTNEMRQMVVLAINVYVNSAVGIAMAVCATVSFMALRVQHKLFTAYGLDEHLSPKATTLTVSVTASFVFTLAFIMSFSLDSFNQTSIVAVVSTNICIALTPAFFIMSLRAVKALPKRLGIIGLLLAAALTFTVMFFFTASPFILPLVGAIYVILGAVDTWAKDFYGKGAKK